MEMMNSMLSVLCTQVHRNTSAQEGDWHELRHCLQEVDNNDIISSKRCIETNPHERHQSSTLSQLHRYIDRSFVHDM